MERGEEQYALVDTVLQPVPDLAQETFQLGVLLFAQAAQDRLQPRATAEDMEG